jgi:hypothetical protein
MLTHAKMDCQHCFCLKNAEKTSAGLAKRCVAMQLTSRRAQSKCLLTYLILMGGSIGMQQNLHLVAFAEIVSMHSGHVVGGKK